MSMQKQIIACGIIAAVTGCLHFALGMITLFYVTNLQYGSPWAAAAVFLAGMLAALSFEQQCLLTAAGIVSTLGCVLCAVGAVVDAVAAAVVVAPLRGCLNSDTGELYGDTQVAQVGFKCLDDDNSQCLCQQSSSSSECYLFDLSSGNNDCGSILTEYKGLLIACTCFDVLNWVVALTLVILTRAWCKAVAAAPPQQQQQQQQQQRDFNSAAAEVAMVVQPSVVDSITMNNADQKQQLYHQQQQQQQQQQPHGVAAAYSYSSIDALTPSAPLAATPAVAVVASSSAAELRLYSAGIVDRI